MGRVLPSQTYSSSSSHPSHSRMNGSARSPTGLTPSSARSEAARLSAQLADVRELLSVHESTLVRAGLDLSSPLVDKDGFPLADVDLLAVRSARQQIHVLRNDRRALEERLHALLQVALQRDESEEAAPRPLRPPPNVGPESSASGTAPAEARAGPSTRLRAFARINSVADGSSPAHLAGLKAEDRLLRVYVPSGTAGEGGDDGEGAAQGVDASHENPLRSLPPLVAEGRAVVFVVERRTDAGASTEEQGETLRLTLTPRSDWGGRGLLG